MSSLIVKEHLLRSIRRKDRGTTSEETIQILDNAEYGVLSTIGKDGQPYGVPLSYVYKNDSIYFHSALSGHKIDNLEYNAKVSFCVVGSTKVLPGKFSTKYESAVVFGVATEVAGAERYSALTWLLEKYCSDFMEEGKQYIARKDKATRVFRIEIRHISGKARR
jgi:hypothetical protein